MTLTRDDLARALQESGAFSRKKAREMVGRLLEVIREQLIQGDTVKLSGFGTFRKVRREPRKGRDASSGATIDIPARETIVFRPSARLRRRLRS